MRSQALGLFVALVALGSVHCGGDDAGGGGGKAAGSEGGPCYGNDTCNSGLVCLSKLCVAPADSGSGGTGNTGGTGGTGGMSGAGGTGSDGGTCDTTRSPSEESCLVSDANAVFVSPTGKSGAAGTKADPLQSFTDAVTKAKSAGHGRVIACNGNYDEKLTLAAAAGGIKIYGGFKCSDWSPDSTERANLKPTTKGIVLTLDTLVAGATFEDVGLIAMAGSAPGESSIAAFVKESGAVSMKRVKLEAGKGVNGAAGMMVPFTYPAQTTLDGKEASGDDGGAYNQVTCPDGTKTNGAKGGGGGIGATNGGLGQPDLGAGKGGVIGACALGGAGGTGNPGAPITPASGAKIAGSLGTSGWSGAAGADGSPGGPGQGGGGGAGATAAMGGGGGGGGGAGACGGAPGKGGAAGGSSIALLALNTAVTLDSSELVSAGGGDGGAGAAGQQGQQIPGAGGNKFGYGCNGGNGGKGADGGAGGGGAGGVSAGVVWKGKAATLTSTTPKVGNKGTKGTGGKPGVNDGIDGDAKPTLEVQ